MPVFIAKYNEIREEKAKDFEENENLQTDGYLDLLGTIKVPRNLKLLSERLPKSNFGEDKKRSRSTGKREASQSSFEKSVASTSAMTASDPSGSYPSQDAKEK